ncbi:MAG: type II CAAX endopeptidase family protein [Isosphaeraceae bacterium]
MVEDPIADDDPDGSPGPLPFAMLVLFEAGLAPASLVLGWVLGVQPLAGFAWDVDAALLGVAAALPMVLFLAVALRWPVGPIRRVKEFFDRELAPALEGCEWPDLAVMSAAAGVGEEMLFRGVIQAAFGKLFGPITAVAVTGVLFGLLHPISAAYAVIAGMLGAYLGVVWLVSGNLLAPMVAHAVYDFIALLVLLSMHRAGQKPNVG